MGTGDLSNFKHCVVVGAGRSFQKLPIYWDFHTLSDFGLAFENPRELSPLMGSRLKWVSPSESIKLGNQEAWVTLLPNWGAKLHQLSRALQIPYPDPTPPLV